MIKVTGGVVVEGRALRILNQFNPIQNERIEPAFYLNNPNDEEGWYFSAETGPYELYGPFRSQDDAADAYRFLKKGYTIDDYWAARNRSDERWGRK